MSGYPESLRFSEVGMKDVSAVLRYGLAAVLAAGIFLMSVYMYMGFACLTVFLIAVFRRPAWGWYLLVLFIPLFGDDLMFYIKQTATNKALIPIFTAFLLVLYFVFITRKWVGVDRRSGTKNPLAVYLTLLIAYAAFVLWTKENPNSKWVFIWLLCNIGLLLFGYVMCMTERSTFDRTIDFFILSGCISAFLVFLSIILHPELRLDERIYSKIHLISSWIPGMSVRRGYSFELSNLASRILNLSACLIMGRLLCASKSKWGYWLLLLLFLVCANFLTLSKGGIGAMMVMFWFIFLFSSRLNGYFIRLSVVSFAGMVLLFILSVLFISIFGDIFRATNLDLSRDSVSISSRLSYWAAGFHAMFKEEAFIGGLGLGGFEYFSGLPTWPHNLYLSFYFDLGLMGMLFLAAGFFVVISYVFKSRLLKRQHTAHQHMALAMCGGVVALAVHGLVDFFYYQSVHWLFGALALAGLQYAWMDTQEARDASKLHPRPFLQLRPIPFG